MTYDRALSALADPTRRMLYEELRYRPRSVGELTATTRISQPAVSQHLRVLSDARLVTHHREGNRHIYRADPNGLAALRAYVEALWGDVLTAFAADDPNPPNSRSRGSR